jgi:hypothetical protein
LSIDSGAPLALAMQNDCQNRGERVEILENSSVMRPSGNHIYKNVKRRWHAPWTPSELKLIGQRTDAVLARRLGRTIKEVVAMRESQHIQPARSNRRWTEAENRMLGTMSDIELARRLKRGVTGVQQQRHKLGISFRLSDTELTRLLGHQGRKVNAYRQRARRLYASNRFQEWEDAFLGKMTDREAARKTGRSINSIRVRRVRLGIPIMYAHPAIRPWMAKEIKLLGTMTDLKLARQLGRRKHQVLAKRLSLKIPSFQHRRPARSWKASEIKLLGRFTDAEVARKIGCTQYTVYKKRIKLGIPAQRPFLPDYRKWTSAEDKLLGTMSDPQVSRRINRSRSAVLARRQRQKIPAYE